MGIASWIAAGLVAFLAGRAIPLARRAAWKLELAVAVLIAGLLGLVATFFDFGGWAELDWRAATLVLLGAFASVGLTRTILFWKNTRPVTVPERNRTIEGHP